MQIEIHIAFIDDGGDFIRHVMFKQRRIGVAGEDAVQINLNEADILPVRLFVHDRHHDQLAGFKHNPSRTNFIGDLADGYGARNLITMHRPCYAPA